MTQSQDTAPKWRGGRVNVGWTERKISTLAGGALVLLGLKRGSLAGIATAGLGAAMIHRGVTGHCSTYSAFGFDTAKDDGAQPSAYFEDGIHVEHSIIIKRPAADLFRYWRDFTNLPTIMSHLKSVQPKDRTTSHWTATGPMGVSVEWDAEIINEEPDALIAWRSLGGADVDNAGSVRFVPTERSARETDVKVVLDYIPPAGRVGAAVAKLFGRDPKKQIADDLFRFKQLMEGADAARR